MIESRFGYGKGYVKGHESSNFSMTDASNLASIHILKIVPRGYYHPNVECYCQDCAGELHEREKCFDTIKCEIENAMQIAWEEGKKYEREM